MTRKQFLKRLRQALKGLGRQERRQYVSDYDEMISDMMENGLTESEAVKRLGSAEKIAKEILENARKEDKKADLPGILLILASAVMTAIAVIRFLTIYSVFGKFTSLSGQSISIIGGADGPTSIFVAGKVSHPIPLYVAAAGLILVTIVYFVRKHRKGKR